MPRWPAAEQSYLFRIERCEPSYGLSIDRRKDAHGRIGEYLHPRFRCECLAPKKVAGRATDIVVIGDRGIDPTSVQRATALGHLTMRGKQCDYLGALETQMLAHVVTGVALKLYRYVYMSGSPLHRGAAVITSLHFEYDFEPSDFPGVQDAAVADAH